MPSQRTDQRTGQRTDARADRRTGGTRTDERADQPTGSKRTGSKPTGSKPAGSKRTGGKRDDQRAGRRTGGQRGDQRSVRRADPDAAAAEPRPPATLREHARRVRACTSCSLHAGRTSPVVGTGPSDARLVLVGLAPSRHEDLQGLPFAGSRRNLLDTALRGAGIDPAEVRFTSVVRCRPPGDRAPTVEEAHTCSPHLRAELRLIAPEVIVSLGVEATAVLLGRPVRLERVAGYRLDILGGTTLIPTHHPGAAALAASRSAELRQHLAVAGAVLDGRLAPGAEALADLRSRVAAER